MRPGATSSCPERFVLITKIKWVNSASHVPRRIKLLCGFFDEDIVFTNTRSIEACRQPIKLAEDTWFCKVSSENPHTASSNTNGLSVLLHVKNSENVGGLRDRAHISRSRAAEESAVGWKQLHLRRALYCKRSDIVLNAPGFCTVLCDTLENGASGMTGSSSSSLLSCTRFSWSVALLLLQETVIDLSIHKHAQGRACAVLYLNICVNIVHNSFYSKLRLRECKSAIQCSTECFVVSNSIATIIVVTNKVHHEKQHKCCFWQKRQNGVTVVFF